VSVAAIAEPVHARLQPAWGGSLPAPGPLDLGDGFVALVSRPGTPWLPNAIVLGPGPPVVWDPFLAPFEPGPALAARGHAILRARDPAPCGGALHPPGAAIDALFAALRSGDPGARRRAARDLLGRGPGLTPEGDDLLAGAAAVSAAAGDPWPLPPELRELTTPLSATLLELAAEGAAARPVHALLDLDDTRWRAALRALESLGASSGRALALGVGAAAAAIGARRPAAACATLHA
jgi:uncharacterized protein DUF2877